MFWLQAVNMQRVDVPLGCQPAVTKVAPLWGAECFWVVGVQRVDIPLGRQPAVTNVTPLWGVFENANIVRIP